VAAPLALADSIVSTSGSEVTISSRDPADTGLRGNTRTFLQHFQDIARNGLRVFPIGPIPAIFTLDPRCFQNPVFNDVVCDVLPTRIVVSGSEGGESVQIGGSNVACEPGPPVETIVDLKGGNDSFEPVSCGGDLANRLAPKVTALGGNGADSLTGGVFSDSLDGGNGNDQLFGGAGDDQLTGAGGADEIDGGAGHDSVSFITTGLGLTVRLDGEANDGFAGEGDNYTSIEVVTGGPANDVLVGSDAAETLRGAAGNDQVTGGGGVDSLSGGDGDDLIDAREGTRDTVSCGSGQDEVVADLVDAVLLRGALSPRVRSRRPECERVERFAADDGPPARAVGRRVRIARDGSLGVRVACPRTARVRCRGRLSLADPRRPGRALAAAAYDIRRGRSALIELELSAGEATRLRARGAVAALTRERGASKKGPRSSLQILVVR
jgi:hypothetical protein